MLHAVKAAGVGIGDPESAIPPARITEPKDKYGWVTCGDDIGYQVRDGKIVALALRSPGAVSKIGLAKDAVEHNRTKIPEIFGRPTRTTFDVLQPDKANMFYYDDRNLVVSVYGQINIVAEPSAKQDLRSYVAASEIFIQQIHKIDSDFSVGLNCEQFGERVRQLVQLQRSIESPPAGNTTAAQFKGYSIQCVEQYTAASKAWENMIRTNSIGPYLRDSAIKEAQKNAQLLDTSFGIMKSQSLNNG